jgi:hypothetical protein
MTQGHQYCRSCGGTNIGYGTPDPVPGQTGLFDDPTEPTVPPTRPTDPTTSKTAAQQGPPRWATQKGRLLIALEHADMIADDAARLLGTAPNNAARRLKDLEEGGYVMRTDRTRYNDSRTHEQIVWTITDKGEHAAARVKADQ